MRAKELKGNYFGAKALVVLVLKNTTGGKMYRRNVDRRDSKDPISSFNSMAGWMDV